MSRRLPPKNTFYSLDQIWTQTLGSRTRQLSTKKDTRKRDLIAAAAIRRAGLSEKVSSETKATEETVEDNRPTETQAKRILDSLQSPQPGGSLARRPGVKAAAHAANVRSESRSFKAEATNGHAIPEGPIETEEEQTLGSEIEKLTKHGKWTINKDGLGLERHMKFSNFKSCWNVVKLMVREARQKKHYHEYTQIQDRVHVRLPSQPGQGISWKDVAMAKFMDNLARLKGERTLDPQEAPWTFEDARIKPTRYVDRVKEEPQHFRLTTHPSHSRAEFYRRARPVIAT